MTNSVRSHYGRSDLETLFDLQPRAVQNLLAMLPTITVGTSRLIEREALLSVLEEVHHAKDVIAFLESLRTRKTTVSRRKLRTLVQRDTAPVSLDALPEGLRLQRGRLEVRFKTVEELARTMYHLARMLETDSDGFAITYEPVRPGRDGGSSDYDVQTLFTELADMEQRPHRVASEGESEPRRRRSRSYAAGDVPS